MLNFIKKIKLVFAIAQICIGWYDKNNARQKRTLICARESEDFGKLFNEGNHSNTSFKCIEYGLQGVKPNLFNNSLKNFFCFLLEISQFVRIRNY